MAHFNRFASIRKTAESCLSIVWGNKVGAFIFAALLLVCSLTVGCSSDKPKPVSYINSNPITQTPSAIANSTLPAPALQTESKPAPKKVVRKRPRHGELQRQDVWRFVRISAEVRHRNRRCGHRPGRHNSPAHELRAAR